MSDFDQFVEDHEDDTDLVRNLRKQLRAASAELKTVKTEAATLKVESRSTSLTKILEAKKLNTKVANFIPEGVEATPEAVDAWLAENGDVFGVAPAAPAAQGIAPEAIAALAHTQGVEHAGEVVAPVGTDASLTRLAELGRTATSFDDLMSQLHKG